MNKKILAIGIIGMFLLTGLTAWGEHTISIKKLDEGPPYVKITKPKPRTIYINNVENRSFPITLIIGWIDIEVKGASKVDFYIDDEFKAPNNYRWDEFSFGRHTLKVVAYDNAGNENTDEMTVWKFF